MSQDFTDWDATAGNNTTIGTGAINIDEGWAAANVNNALREVMAACVRSAGLPGLDGTSRPTGTLAGQFWLNTTTATAPIITFYDGTDDIAFATINYSTNVITIDSSVVFPSAGIANVVEDTTPQLGGNLDLNGNVITGLEIGTNVQAYDADLTALAAVTAVAGDIIYGSGAATWARLATGSDDEVLTLASGIPSWATASSGGFGNELIHVREEQTAGTAGGTFTSGSMQTRTLNTVVTNQITGASVATNQITLPAGSYIAIASAPAFRVVGHIAQLYDTTGTAVLETGTSENSRNGTDTVPTRSWVHARFTLSVESDIELQHRANTTRSTDGFGIAASVSTTEVFGEVMIWKVG
jgi:hypothetical protein